MLSMATSILFGFLRSVIFAATAFPQLYGNAFATAPSTILISISGTTLSGFFTCTMTVGQMPPANAFNGTVQVVDTTASAVVAVAPKGGGNPGTISNIKTPGIYFFAVPAGDSFVVQTTSWTSGTAPVNLLCPYQRPT